MFRLSLISFAILFSILNIHSSLAQDTTYAEYFQLGRKTFHHAGDMRFNSFLPLGYDNEIYYPDIYDKYKEAARYFEKANDLKPDNQEAHYFLGCTYDKIFSEKFEFSYDHFGRFGKTYNTFRDRTIQISEQFEQSIKDDAKYTGIIINRGPRSMITKAWTMLAYNYFLNDKPDSISYAFKEGKRRGGFPDELLEYARNIITVCDSNAILMASDRAKIYAIWYLQQVEGFRKDVVVLNTYYIRLPEYLKTYKYNPPFGGSPIPFSFPDSVLVSDTSSLSLSAIECDSLYKDSIVVNKNIISAILDSVSGNADTTIFLNFRATNSTGPNTRTINGVSQTIKKKFHLGPGDLAQMDILKNMSLQRPVYYSDMLYSRIIDFEYFILEGYAYRFYPIKAKETKFGECDFEKCDKFYLESDLLSEKYDSQYNELRLIHSVDYDGPFLEMDNYIRTIVWGFIDCANHFGEMGKKKKAVQIINKVQKLFPPSKFQYKHNMQAMIRFCETLKLNIRKYKFAEVYYLYCINEIENYSEYSNKAFYQILPRSIVGAAFALKRLEEIEAQPEKIKELKKLWRKYKYQLAYIKNLPDYMYDEYYEKYFSDEDED